MPSGGKGVNGPPSGKATNLPNIKNKEGGVGGLPIASKKVKGELKEVIRKEKSTKDEIKGINKVLNSPSKTSQEKVIKVMIKKEIKKAPKTEQGITDAIQKVTGNPITLKDGAEYDDEEIVEYDKSNNEFIMMDGESININDIAIVTGEAKKMLIEATKRLKEKDVVIDEKTKKEIKEVIAIIDVKDIVVKKGKNIDKKDVKKIAQHAKHMAFAHDVAQDILVERKAIEALGPSASRSDKLAARRRIQERIRGSKIKHNGFRTTQLEVTDVFIQAIESEKKSALIIKNMTQQVIVFIDEMEWIFTTLWKIITFKIYKKGEFKKTIISLAKLLRDVLKVSIDAALIIAKMFAPLMKQALSSAAKQGKDKITGLVKKGSQGDISKQTFKQLTGQPGEKMATTGPVIDIKKIPKESKFEEKFEKFTEKHDI